MARMLWPNLLSRLREALVLLVRCFHLLCGLHKTRSRLRRAAGTAPFRWGAGTLGLLVSPG